MDAQRPGTSEVFIWALSGVNGDRVADHGALALADLAAPEIFSPAVSITSLVSGGRLVAFVTGERRLYLLDLQPLPAQNIPRIVKALGSQKVENVSCGHSHVVTIISGGDACCLEEAGEADPNGGWGAALATSGRLVTLKLPARAQLVSCGRAHVLIATDSGAIYAFGDGSQGQLGLANTLSKDSPVALPDLAHLRVVGIAAGHAHSCAVTSFGNLFTWGDNRHGQLGDGSQESRNVPHLVASVEAVQSAVANFATAVICARGSSFAWGFGNKRLPVTAFERPVGHLALSGCVMCGVTLNGELLLRSLDGQSSQTFLVHRGVSEVAAAGGHVVALGGPPPTLAATPYQKKTVPTTGSSSHLHPLERGELKASLRHASPEPAPHVSQFPSIDTFKHEVAKLEAENVQLGMTLDEVRTLAFFEIAQVQRLEEAATRRSVQAMLDLTKEREKFVRVDRVRQIVILQDELEGHRAELRAEEASFDREHAQGNTSAIGTRSNSGDTSGVADAVARDLRDKHSQLTFEHGRLCEEREAVQAQILSVRVDLTESGQRLRSIEDACARTRAMLERQRVQNASTRETTTRAQVELERIESRIPFTASEASRVELAAKSARCDTLRVEKTQLEKDKELLIRQLAEVKASLDRQTRDHHGFLAESQRLAQEHATEEQNMARQQLLCSRLDGEIACLKTELSQSQKQARDLHDAFASSEKQLADETLMRGHVLRAQLESGSHLGPHRANLMQQTLQLRERLAYARAECEAQSTSLHSRASKFAEETAPLYSEVQRLHASLSELRKRPASHGPAVDAVTPPFQYSVAGLGSGTNGLVTRPIELATPMFNNSVAGRDSGGASGLVAQAFGPRALQQPAMKMPMVEQSVIPTLQLGMGIAPVSPRLRAEDRMRLELAPPQTLVGSGFGLDLGGGASHPSSLPGEIFP